MRAVTAGLLLFAATLIVSSATVDAQTLAPNGLQASATGSNIVIRWHAAGDVVPDGFRLEAGSAPGLTDLAVVNIPWSKWQGLDAQFSAGGVAPGVYYLRVRGVYGNSVSAASDEVRMQVGTSACPLPNAPRNVTARVEHRVVMLEWDAAAGAAAAGFVIEAGTQPGAPNVAIIAMDATRVSLSAAPGRYYVRLRAMGMCGASEPSPETVIVVPNGQ